MPIQLMQQYSREDLQANPDKMFVFGDNMGRDGYGGQAASARGEPNAIGIVTKKAPSHNEDDFMSDNEYTENVQAILADFSEVFEALKVGKIVVWPMNGIGTGLADLPKRAPQTLQFINTVKNALIVIYGVVEFA